jgi:hypothetical protein
MLDLHIDEYWFNPSWTHWPPGFDYQPLDLPSGLTTEVVLPEFTWPDAGPDRCGPITIWGALLNAELTESNGTVGHDSFSYGPPG